MGAKVMLIPEGEEAEGTRRAEHIDVVVERRLDDDGVAVYTSSFEIMEDVDDDELVGVHSDHVFEALVYGLYQQFQQEREIGASEWNDYLDQVVDLLQRIHSGDDTLEKRREYDA